MSRSSTLAESLLSGRPLASLAPNRGPVTVQRLVESAARNGRGLTLDEAQVSELRRLLEAMRDDPFQNGESIVDTQDLEALGVKVSEQEQLGIAPNTHDSLLNQGGERQQEFHAERRQPQLGVQASLVAPNATPGHSDPIPEKVILAMMAVSPESFSEATPSIPDAPRPQPPVHGMPAPRPRQAPQPQPQAGGDDVLSAVQNARRKRQQSPMGGLRKTRPRAGHQGPVPAGFSDKLNQLGGPDD